MFYKIDTDMPVNYTNFEIPIMLVMVAVPISMLALFDCYNVVWKYAGRVEFIKFLISYIASFLILLIIKAIIQAAFNVELWTTQILLFLLFAMFTTDRKSVV